MDTKEGESMILTGVLWRHKLDL